MTTTSNQPPKVTEFGAASINRSQLSEPVKEVLHAIQNEVSGAYRESFILMKDGLTRQASRLDRIQQTLSILVGALQPQLQDRGAPAAFRIAGPDEAPDVAAAIMVADPIGSGYTLRESSIAKHSALLRRTFPSSRARSTWHRTKDARSWCVEGSSARSSTITRARWSE